MMFDWSHLNIQMFKQQQDQWKQIWHSFTWPADESRSVTRSSLQTAVQRTARKTTAAYFTSFHHQSAFPLRSLSEWGLCEWVHMMPDTSFHQQSGGISEALRTDRKSGQEIWNHVLRVNDEIFFFFSALACSSSELLIVRGNAALNNACLSKAIVLLVPVVPAAEIRAEWCFL